MVQRAKLTKSTNVVLHLISNFDGQLGPLCKAVVGLIECSSNGAGLRHKSCYGQWPCPVSAACPVHLHYASQPAPPAKVCQACGFLVLDTCSSELWLTQVMFDRGARRAKREGIMQGVGKTKQRKRHV